MWYQQQRAAEFGLELKNEGEVSLELLLDKAERDETLWTLFEDELALNSGEDGSEERNGEPDHLGGHYYATQEWQEMDINWVKVPAGIKRELKESEKGATLLYLFLKKIYWMPAPGQALGYLLRI